MAFGGFLKQGTAVNVIIGQFVDDTNGKDPETTLTITQSDVQLMKNGGAAAQKNDETSCTHRVNGEYACPLNATDTNTVGRLKLSVYKSGALGPSITYQVVEEDIYTALFATAGNLGFDSSGRVDVGGIVGMPPQNDGLGRFEVILKDDAITSAKYDESTAFPVKSNDSGSTQIARVGADGDTLETLSDQLDGTALASVCTEARLAELDAANLPADIDTLITRLTAARAGYLDELAAANIPADVDTVLSRLTAARAGYLDNLSAGAVALASICTEARLAELDAANMPADIATIIGYIDTEIAAILAAVDTEVVAIKAKTDNLPGSPAAVGSQMNLADDAITADKYDQSTAHPITTAMKEAGSVIIRGTVSYDNTAASTTVFYSDDITEATADHYNGRIVVFTSGALLGQATDITDYALVSGEGKFTVTALTEAPADNVTFVIV